MSARDREGLIARIRQVRRATAAANEPAPPSTPTAAPEGTLAALAARLAHLEALVQGLQDSVHRESGRQSDRIAELEERTQPAALARALSEDARTRGL